MKKNRINLSKLVPYIYVILVDILVSGLLYAFEGLIRPSGAALALLFLLPVGVSTILWGLGPGIFSALLAFLSFNFFFLTPRYSLSVHQTQDLIVLLVFLGISIVISQLVGRTQKSLAEAKKREREAIRLYELSAAIAGMDDDQSIGQVIADRVLETFQAERVEVFVERTTDGNRETLQVSAEREVVSLHETQLPGDPILMPLQASSGLLGEIRIWRSKNDLSVSEEQLLRTFASQGVLALERAWLSQADTRARVLEESDRLKTSLLSSVSHELRTPLATIKASVTSLQIEEVGWDSEARSELLTAIEEETDHLNQLVSNLLNMSRIEAGVLQPERRWNVLEEIASTAIHRLRAQEHQMIMEFPEDLPLVPVDWIQLEQVFTNLLSNSIKYSPPQSTVYVTAQKIDPLYVQVHVTNAGPHVPEDELVRIFDKFHRLDPNDRVTGSGLGLSICKGIIEAHGGQIWAENRSDGFTFIFLLPLRWEGETPHLPEDEG